MAEAEQQPVTKDVIWTPHEGSQVRFLTCPMWEILYEGERGPGKTDALLMKFAQHVGLGYGNSWRGVIFRREYKHLDDIIAKSKKWFKQIFPTARWLSSKSDYKWVWPDGEELLFRQFKKTDDYWNYHGHEYPFMGWEELTNWPTDESYEMMKSCSRSSRHDMPRIYASTANPWGVGHGWVKARFIDIGKAETVKTDQYGNTRVRIHGSTAENSHLLAADPMYIKRLEAIENEDLRKAWKDGDWNVSVGGFLQGIWESKRHIVKTFDPPIDWPRWRAMDWGYAKPYSCGWYCISPDDVIYRYRELYGYGGKANKGTRESADEVARKIYKIEAVERKLGVVFKRSPADGIFMNDGREHTIDEMFRAEKIRWIKPKKGPGSRKQGAQVIVKALRNNQFKVMDCCVHWLRTVPNMMPDPDDWDDVDTEQEDHTWDETMYSLRSRHKALKADDDDNGPSPGSFDWMLKVTANQRKLNKRKV